MEITKQDVANYLSTNVDWNLMYSLTDTIGKTMNAPKDRFEKSDLLEKALSVFSVDEKIEYINAPGMDHFYKHFGVSAEMKYSTNGLYSIKKPKTKKIIVLKEEVKNIRLENPNSGTLRTELSPTYADFLLLMDINGAAIIDKSTLKKYLNFGPGFVDANNIPINEFAMIFNACNNVTRTVKTNFNYKEEKDKFQLNFLKSF